MAKDSVMILGKEIPWSDCLIGFDCLILLFFVVVIYAGYRKAQKDHRCEEKRKAKAEKNNGAVEDVKTAQSPSKDEPKSNKKEEKPGKVASPKLSSPKASTNKKVSSPNVNEEEEEVNVPTTTPKKRTSRKKVVEEKEMEGGEEKEAIAPTTTPKKRATRKSTATTEVLGQVMSPEGRRSSRLRSKTIEQ